jgi:hypothetical protein
VEPLLWLSLPFVLTALVVSAIVLRQRIRPSDPSSRQRQRAADLQRMASALGADRPDSRRDTGAASS